MSILKLLGIKSSILSFLEILVFFGLISRVFFSLVFGLYVGIASLAAQPAEVPSTGVELTSPARTDGLVQAPAGAAGGDAEDSIDFQPTPRLTAELLLMPRFPFDLHLWFGLIPSWMWVVAGLGYVILITAYWSPSEGKLDQTELRGFVIFVVFMLVVGGIALEVKYHGVSRQLELFWSILTGRYPQAKPA